LPLPEVQVPIPTLDLESGTPFYLRTVQTKPADASVSVPRVTTSSTDATKLFDVPTGLSWTTGTIAVPNWLKPIKQAFTGSADDFTYSEPSGFTSNVGRYWKYQDFDVEVPSIPIPLPLLSDEPSQPGDEPLFRVPTAGDPMVVTAKLNEIDFALYLVWKDGELGIEVGEADQTGPIGSFTSFRSMFL
jgi:hypothetical protein